MKLFGKNKTEERLEFLEAEIKRVVEKIYELEKEVKKPRCFESGESIPENTLLNRFGHYVEAIIDFLGINIKENWIDDENFSEPQRPQRKVWKAIKKL